MRLGDCLATTTAAAAKIVCALYERERVCAFVSACVCAHAHMCVRVCVCVCVRERERERQRECV